MALNTSPHRGNHSSSWTDLPSLNPPNLCNPQKVWGLFPASSVQPALVRQDVLQTHRDGNISGLWPHFHSAAVSLSVRSRIISQIHRSLVDCYSPNCVRSQYHTIQKHDCKSFCIQRYVRRVRNSGSLGNYTNKSSFPKGDNRGAYRCLRTLQLNSYAFSNPNSSYLPFARQETC